MAACIPTLSTSSAGRRCSFLGICCRRHQIQNERIFAKNTTSLKTSTFEVMMMGNAEVARLLLESGANPNVQDSSGIAPIHDAARSGFVATLRVLVEYGALVNVADHFGALPIHIAIREGHRDAVEFLAPCSDLWHTNARGQTPVDVARASRRPDMIHLLLAHI
ncbi:cyclin-dependent kinase 4 inhibitor D isoform X1 [Phyllopteryx taeniolatus]|uniref:cyclin-dependent kinase 4 inhibitor D isoform X1 n=1 Tax=Phyllopteryx taeniolatus TaxID=161469 RepID=UPI002AD215DA|nr:cyclin-dependent kinase 4 inhibitor D isoform X1 [Phyllopteryx taeniolatus]